MFKRSLRASTSTLHPTPPPRFNPRNAPPPFRAPHRTKHSSAFEPPPFKPPPISTRLKPLIPFFIYWSIITSLAVHLLRTRIRTKEEMDHSKAQISVLSGLITRFSSGDTVPEDELQRELEMVGLRERTILSAGTDGVADDLKELRDVGWYEVIFGQRRKSAEEEERQAEVEWANVINEAQTPVVPSPSSPNTRKGVAKRATSANVYL